MKSILLLAPRVIAGAVRYPIEGVLTVTDEEADAAIADKAAEPAHDVNGQELADMKVADLKSLAAAEEIDLGKAKSHDDIVAAIEAARAEREKPAE